MDSEIVRKGNCNVRKAQSVTIEGAHTYHSLYLAVHAAHAEAPHIWTVSHCTRLLTSIMSAKPFAWHVVGVTKAALKKFHGIRAGMV
jgi:hypothetical protein